MICMFKSNKYLGKYIKLLLVSTQADLSKSNRDIQLNPDSR